MKHEIKVPSVGESVTQADIESWERQTGDFVKKGEVLAILETDKASLEIAAEADGALAIAKEKGAAVSVGDVIGFIDTAAVKTNRSRAFLNTESSNTESLNTESAAEGEAPLKKPAPQTPPAKSASEQTAPAKSVQTREGFAGIDLDESLSPSVRRLIAENKLTPPYGISGTGRGGRLTKEDVLKALKSQEGGPAGAENPTPAPPLKSSSSKSAAELPESAPLKEGQRREPMTRLRKITAERLVLSQQSTASLSTFNEADMSRILQLRRDWQEPFMKKHGVKLGFMGFFVKAAVAALKAYPKINAFIDGTDIVYNDSRHIGIAISAEKGLVVPVIFHAEKLSLGEIEKQIIVYRDKAISRKLAPDDLFGGTFTISNGGVFGSLLSTPILNPPQSGILGMHKIEERPVAVNGKVEIRPMMYLALSYDHRMVDGRESVGFLAKVKEGLEEPARLLLDI